MKTRKHIKNTGWLIALLIMAIIRTDAQKYVDFEYVTVPTGSYIIDMGTNSPTFNVSLWPYGLVHEVLHEFNVPVYWVIDTSKTSQSTPDFSHNGKDYFGGPFVIHANYRTAALDSTINVWIEGFDGPGGDDGLIVDTTVSNQLVPKALELTAIPNWVLDMQNGSIAEDYFTNAKINSSYFAIKEPDSLNCCDQVYAMPHADPDWSTHSNLYDYVVGCKGAIWAACHAVSVLEDVENPLDSTQRLNFLSTDGLVSHKDHEDGSLPYTYGDFGHPVSQIVGALEDASTNGSEQIFLPKLGSAWRTSTITSVTDPDHDNLPGGSNNYLSDGPAVAVAFGRAYGNDTLGFVMYQGGHDHDKFNGPDNVNAQRTFFNFAFFASYERSKEMEFEVNAPNIILEGASDTLTVNINSGTAPYNIEWSNTCGGSFTDQTTATTVWTAPTNPSESSCFVTVRVTDGCNNVFFKSWEVTFPKAPEAQADTTICGINGSRLIPVLENDVDFNNDIDTTSVAILTGYGPSNGTVSVNNGVFNYTPHANYLGDDFFTYLVCDEYNLCDTAQVWIKVSCMEIPMNANGIKGDAFMDLNENGIPDPGENAMENLLFRFRWDRDKDGIVSTADSFIEKKYTDANGSFDFQRTHDFNISKSKAKTLSAEVEDGEETLNNGDVDLHNNKVSIGSGNARLVGFLFGNLDIPARARITSARVKLFAKDSKSDPTDITIWGEQSANATSLSTSFYDLSQRTKTVQSTLWSNVEEFVKNKEYYSADIREVIQEIVDLPGWSNNNNIHVLMQGTGNRTAYTTSPGAAFNPELQVTYTYQDTVFYIMELDTGSMSEEFIVPEESRISKFNFTEGGETSCGLSLPIRPGAFLLNNSYFDFTVEMAHNKIELKWNIESPADLSHFNIQRSDNGKDFLTISIEDRSSDQDRWTDHIYYDAIPGPGDFYYKIVAVDKNGRTLDSDIKVIHIDDLMLGGNEFQVYPTIVEGDRFLNIVWNGNRDVNATVNIVNLQGQSVRQFNQLYLQPGIPVRVQLGEISSGNYLVNSHGNLMDNKVFMIIVR